MIPLRLVLFVDPCAIIPCCCVSIIALHICDHK